MNRLRFCLRIILIPLALLSGAAGLIACNALPGKPSVVIASPPSGSTYREGDDVAIQSTSADTQGVVRVELTIDGAVVRNDTPPSAQTNFSLIQSWKATQGNHTIIVRAYNAAGAASDPAAISIQVNPAVALNNPTPTSASAPPTIPTIPTITSAPAPPVGPSPTNTTAVPPGPVACTNSAAFVADVTVPDGTIFAAGQTFNKIWRLSNNGTCAWGVGYQFVFVSGEAMTASTVVAVPATAAGATADLLVPMTASTVAGNHSGTWRMRSAGGAIFGQAVSVKITVPGAPPPVPPPSGCSGAAVIALFTAASPTITAGSSTTLNWGAVTNADSVEIDHGIGGVPAPGSTSVSPGSTTTFTMTAHCGSNAATAQVTITVVPPLPPAVFVGNFSGDWLTNFGTMHITQSGGGVTGTYHNSFNNPASSNGTIAGTVSSNTLNGTYTIGGSGSIQFTLGGGGNTFDGNWGGSNKWCGARSGTAFPSGCGYSGSWSTSLTGYPPCSMTLTQTDASVTGTYCNGTITGGVTSFTSDAAVLTGLWHVGSATGSIEFYLLGYNDLQFQGSYGGSTYWCGWRGGASAPSPCQR